MHGRYENAYQYKEPSQGHGYKIWSNPNIGNAGGCPLTYVVDSMLDAAFVATSTCCQGGTGRNEGKALLPMRDVLLPKLKAIAGFLSSADFEKGPRKAMQKAKIEQPAKSEQHEFTTESTKGIGNERNAD